MSSPTPSPPSLRSDPNDSRDSTLTDQSDNETDYNASTIHSDNKADSNTVTPQGVGDILTVSNYPSDGPFQNCKGEVLSSIPQSFVQDYNSRDSTGFSIQDILGLHQSYNAANTEDLEPRYDYQIINYENISNSSNNYASGAEDVIVEDCINKNDNVYNSSIQQLDNQVIYNRNYTANELVQYVQRSGLEADDAKDSTREVNETHDSSFPTQVCMIKCALLLKK